MTRKYKESEYWQMLDRQKEIISREEQLLLKNCQVLVVGCGGIGGAAAEMLARMGVGKIKVIDKDYFELSNLNRQLMSDLSNIGRLKAEVTREALQKINPLMQVEAFSQELTADNVSSLLDGCSIVIDALDNLLSRIIVGREALKKNIPFVHGAIHGTQGQITTFTPRTVSYEEMFQLPSHGKDLTSAVREAVAKLNQEVPPSISSVPNIVGCIQAFEVMKIITARGSPVLAPDMLVFDLLKKNPFSLVQL
ncbi:HesA/MoeB/ThiF family protein [Methanobacterium sp. CWC-01]|uniref:HesA/MoeB/ThiF family protein n=1 Tax=Methanobacterium aridiramus TaxID=2584467 RepID=UPI0025787EE5|nr:HesA/MoeB/ThiF family protein [Methanobacterium sp. CWC-01]WJI09374.1 HesA/MoeB/ThiF family protein [Methanobacterium sp. CWC-01]